MRIVFKEASIFLGIVLAGFVIGELFPDSENLWGLEYCVFGSEGKFIMIFGYPLCLAFRWNRRFNKSAGKLKA